MRIKDSSFTRGRIISGILARDRTLACRRVLFSSIAILLTLFTLTTPVRASESLQRRPANLTIDPLKPIITGDHPTITVHLTAEFGKPIPNQPIVILVDGKRKADGKTDSRGIAAITLKYKFSAKTYRVQAYYSGIPSIGVNRAVAETDMVVEPAKLAIYTIPATPGAVFKLNGQPYTADQNGVVNIQVNTSGMYSLEVLPIDQNTLPANVRMEFARWNDNVFTSSRQVYFPRDHRLEAGFTIKYQVDQVFHDTEGKLVDPARISSMAIKGIGNTYRFGKAGPIWLPANHLTRRIGQRLESNEVLYYFREVTIDGASVINKSEQRFRIRPNDVWPVQVLLYSVNFSARDALFHFPTGKGIELTYPDGSQQQFLFDSPDAELTISSLARGSYSARIIGAGGSAPLTPIHLSRDQDVELLIVSYLDMGILFLVEIVIALGLLFLGRPEVVTRALTAVYRVIFTRRGIQPAE